MNLRPAVWTQAPGLSEPAGKVEVKAPFDGQVIAAVETSTPQALAQAMDRAAALFTDREAWLPTPERIQILDRLGQLMQAQADELAVEAAREGGKPLTDSQVEVQRAIDCARICTETLRSQAGDMVPMNVSPSSAGRLALTLPEPIGPVLAVSAFNHPLNLIAHQVLPAFAVGAPVIVKPARSTPLSCWRLCALLAEAGAPDGWVTPLLPDSNAAFADVIEDARLGFFSFIGSAKVGFKLQKQLAPGVRSALEHGGVAPVIVREDADLDKVLPGLVKGSFYHAGQVCVSVQRIFVARSRAEELTQRLVQAAQALKLGDPIEHDTEVGPLIAVEERDRVAEWVSEAVAAGAQLLCGGQAQGYAGYSPTVLLNPPDQVRVSTDEVFGPVVCVYPVDDDAEALSRANQLPVSFQAAVCTQDVDAALHLARSLKAQAVMVNDHTAFRVDWMPFGGQQQSGYGLGGIPYSMAEMQVQKMVVIQSAALR
nr:aldehyde dehydrogenase family protein [Oceanococcus sp. HetDA_MAG_MS8]